MTKDGFSLYFFMSDMQGKKFGMSFFSSSVVITLFLQYEFLFFSLVLLLMRFSLSMVEISGLEWGSFF